MSKPIGKSAMFSPHEKTLVVVNHQREVWGDSIAPRGVYSCDCGNPACTGWRGGGFGTGTYSNVSSEREAKEILSGI